MTSIIRSFAPLAAPNAEILVLGSMPGVASLDAQQYYAHPRNAFWPIMGSLFGAGPDTSYAERIAILKDRRIALWDVLHSCVRPGSLDADISAEIPNDFAAFFAAHPRITKIALNGGKAAGAFKKHAAHLAPAGAAVIQLPSTSPAHAVRSFEQKCAAWRAALL